MRNRIWTLLILVVAGALAAASSPARAESAGQAIAREAVVNAKPFSLTDDPYPDHHVAFPDGVKGLPDVTYQILPGYRPMKLDLYLPPASFKGPRPAIVFIHGGGWQYGGPRLTGAFDNWPTVLAAISARGYVVASVSYRFLDEAPSPAAIQDVKAAIRWLRVKSGVYGVDRGRILAWGASAGGQLAALAASSCGVAALEPQPAKAAGPGAESDCVQGAVTWYGVFDFRPIGAAGAIQRYLGCGDRACTPDELAAASPIAYANERTPPMLMIAGSDDHLVPPAQSRDFYAALQSRHVRSELMIIPDVDHSFIGKSPETTRQASKIALARTLEFIERTIGDARN